MSEHYRLLGEKVDAFFARVVARHPEELQCDRGCYDCCDVRLTITAVEAAAVRAAWHALSDERRAEVRATWRPDATACAALDRQGRCAVYSGRPLVCRSHGVPIRLAGEKASLPVIQACFRNFGDRGPEAADADCVLDQTTLSAMLLLVEQQDAEACGREAGLRMDLAEVLREPVG
ncbi:MAG: YkgJ family cysteine cluster protein [Kofleriaceae bacterium]